MWKTDWEQSRARYVDWWNRRGMVVGMMGTLRDPSVCHEAVERPPAPLSIEDQYTNAAPRAQRNHWDLANRLYPADVLPIAETDLGPGSLALFLGSEPHFSKDTIWFEPSIRDCAEPETLPPFRFDETNRWWKVTESILRESARLARGKYLVGCPDLIENVDILSALRDPQTLMMDMIERPEWVEQKVREINRVWFEAYGRIYEIIKLEDGSSAFGAFRLWGPGKTAKVQCDAAAMFSPAMFRRFVVPALTEQCEWLDHSLFHLDGTQAMCHLDALLEIEALDAIEWTPQAGIETGGHARWYDMYKRILAAGKSVQVLHVGIDEIAPLLDAIGTAGVYLLARCRGVADAEAILKRTETHQTSMSR
jgi:hypothetical protein